MEFNLLSCILRHFAELGKRFSATNTTGICQATRGEVSSACDKFATARHVLPLFDTCQQHVFHAERYAIYNKPASQPVFALARQDAIDAGIPPGLFVRQIDRESGFDPRALSPSGAEGIAQFMPKTAASLGIDPWNPVAALKGAAQLMAHYTKMFAGTYAKALATYNAGLGTVQHALKVCGKVHWMNCLPVETQQYIAVISG